MGCITEGSSHGDEVGGNGRVRDVAKAHASGGGRVAKQGCRERGEVGAAGEITEEGGI